MESIRPIQLISQELNREAALCTLGRVQTVIRNGLCGSTHHVELRQSTEFLEID